MPCVLAWLVAGHLRRARPAGAVLFAVAGLAALNNPEFGSAALLALAAALASPGPGHRCRALSALVPRAALGLAAALLFVVAIALIRAGSLPDLGLLTHFSRLFGSQSFGLIAMPKRSVCTSRSISPSSPRPCSRPCAASRAARPRPDRGAHLRRPLRPGRGRLLRRPFDCPAADPRVPDLGLRPRAAGLGRGGRPAVADRRPQPRRAVPPALPAALATILAFGVMVAAITTAPPPWQQLERLTEDERPVTFVPAIEAFVADQRRHDEPILFIGPPNDHLIADAPPPRTSRPGSAISFFATEQVDHALEPLEAEGGRWSCSRRQYR